MKIAYLDCFSGISGDMFLAALTDAGVPFSVLEDAVKAVGLEARLELKRVDRSGIDAAKVDVLTAEGELAETAPDAGVSHSHSHGAADNAQEHHHHEHAHDHHHDHSHEHDHPHGEGHAHDHSHDHAQVHGRSLSVIQGMIRGSRLPVEVQTIALDAFALLGEAEGRIHNVPVERIHFHEVGAVDAIADIVAVAAGCHWLAADKWMCSPLNVGGGHVHCAHGVFPVPAPATLELLRDLPVYSSGVKKELVTPTGAALLRALQVSSSNFPLMRMQATGYGAGSRDLPGRPNVLRLVVGETADAARPVAGQGAVTRVGVIETAIDDATPEVLSYVADKLLEAGALDVYRVPMLMKKGRAGVQLTVLCAPDIAASLQQLIFTETTTLGLRYREEEKRSLAREFVEVETEWGPVAMKIGLLDDGQVVNAAPEFEDCRRIAEERGLPLKEVMKAAAAAYLLKGMRA